MKYKHLFFDLDHTLWDFERNSSECLTTVYHTFEMAGLGIQPLEAFISTYLSINYQLWRELERGEIPHSHIRKYRFRRVLEEFRVDPGVNFEPMEDAYMALLPTKPHLIDGATDLLDYARGQGYTLHILTNGFDEVQGRKMQSSGIFDYFTHLITNEKAQSRKPDRRIFEYALASANAHCHESLMIGDNWEADILGAKQIGMDTVFFNPAGRSFAESPTHDIRHLSELRAVL